MALVSTFAQVYDGVRDWAQGQFLNWWPFVATGWFVALTGLLILGYIGALIYTGSPAPELAIPQQAKPAKPRVRATDVAIEEYERATRAASAAGITSTDGLNRFYPPTVRREKGDRDTRLSDALGYAMSGNWETPIGFGLAFSRKGLRALEQPLVTFRKAATGGDLRVWGKRESDGLYQLIDPAFWKSNTIDPDALVSLMPLARTVRTGRGKSDEQFHDIMVNRADVESVWPHEG